MSVELNISIPLDQATPAIAAKVAQCAPTRLAAIVAPPLETFTRVHLRDNGTNKRGWPSTHFWESASRATTASVKAGTVTITVDQIGVRQRWLGGVIKPVTAKALTIPISPVSYGHTAGEFAGLFLLKTPKGAYLVQAGQELSESGNFVKRKKAGGNSSSRRKGTLNFLFKLVPSVTQAPDPTVLPTADQFQEVAMAAVERSIA